MLNRASKPFVKLVERYLPDPYIFVLLLTLITFAFAVVIQNQSPLTTIQQWGDGFWGLLTFSMQMLLVLVTGFMLACTPLVKALLERLASLAKSPGSAIVLVTLVSLIASWINWGFGLVVGALFAKALARKVSVDYRLLVASAYSGFIVWHGGLAGSVPLTIATPGHFSEAQIGVVGTGETIFSGFNLLLLAIMFVIIPLVNRLMLPPESESIIVDSAKLKDDALPSATNERPADKLENSKVLGLLVGFAGLAYLTNYFVSGGGLNLNIVNTLFLFLAIVLHGTPRNVLHSLQQAVQGGSGIVIQFPFYAGIMAVMVQSGLAQTMSEWLISFASAESLPVWSFISAGIVNIFVPSGGGQWAVQAPVILPAAAELGAEINRVAMAVAWGDAWTNLIQPFWALPVLAIAGLKAKDIMGFCLVQLIVTGVIISLVLRFV
ncbi:short-chain fatty acid transporter [Alteromonas sp. DY56-G5]|jgi:short-chain fatty acids transporter|uniref:Short chain fatty acid transporter family protein n=1 Tax=Alteromonas macleodii TaxID=28108 RepID=A0A1E7DCL2_ALTMA|nr:MULTISPECIES: short-chain fatty acid transporter [Alteromonas]MCH2255460.1 short-chain fatty acid transporter [Alteromonas sp.]MEC8488264.1 short-chain fatty acid transporter [Pseudomonadota bacterium]AMN12317.1 short-chain fatty acid transporter [Alteromonas macleodii]KHT53535.1 short-chain fatty acid transporter [Alteromonas macleodii]MEC8966421.1 short-chain fatty acid transporter [Pseudomonadota bacterium]|tara:strand:- start:1646 stop:2953 length:1308 start_codon:yes stop_codon:yes gene_type:complete